MNLSKSRFNVEAAFYILIKHISFVEGISERQWSIFLYICFLLALAGADFFLAAFDFGLKSTLKPIQ